MEVDLVLPEQSPAAYGQNSQMILKQNLQKNSGRYRNTRDYPILDTWSGTVFLHEKKHTAADYDPVQ